MDTASNVAALPSDPQSNGASNVDEILTLIGAISLSPGDVQHLTTAIHHHINSSGDTDLDDDSSTISDSEETSLQVPAPVTTTTALLPTSTMPPAPALVTAEEPAATPVQVQAAADPALPGTAAATLPTQSQAIAPAIPAEYFTSSYHGVLFLLPLQYIPGPYYLITKGRSIEVVANWSCALPMVTDVKGAVFHKISSVGLGLQSMLSVINNGAVEYL